MNDSNESERTDSADAGLCIQMESLRDYERLYKPHELSRAILTFQGESVLIRRPFRWTRDGVDLIDVNARMELEEICENHGWKIVERYGPHIGIVSRPSEST